VNPVTRFCAHSGPGANVMNTILSYFRAIFCEKICYFLANL
jgi:hypothetical protein